MSRSMFAVTAYSNMSRYERRPVLYNRFKQMMATSGVNLITVELAMGDREFEVTSPRNPFHLQLRAPEASEFFHKENLCNLGIAHGRKLFPQATEVAWIDGDCRPAMLPIDWMLATWHALQRYKFVQMWEWFQPLDYYYAPIGGPSPSFMANYIKFGNPYPADSAGYPSRWGSPGLCWAANISSLDEIGGIPDVAILGAGDWYLAHMLISTLPLPDMEKNNYSPGYKNYWAQKQSLCDRYIQKDVGFVKGLVYHDWHGKTINRGYNTRERILIDNQYDPNVDLVKEPNGVYRIETHEPRQIKMYQQIRAYFDARNEDEIS